jgi:PPOX class probable F420-dependent enzyme
MPRSTFDHSDRELIKGRNFCHVATLNEDGSVHSTLVWSDLDGDRVVLNSAQGRKWPENVKRDGRATLLIANSENPYEYVRIDARLDEATEEGAMDVINALAKKYTGADEYGNLQPGERRITLKLAPERITHHGG